MWVFIHWHVFFSFSITLSIKWQGIWINSNSLREYVNVPVVEARSAPVRFATFYLIVIYWYSVIVVVVVVVKAVFKCWWCWCVIVSLLLLHIVLKIFMTRNACLQACCNRFDHDDYSRNFHQINNEVDLDYSGVFFFSLHKYTNTHRYFLYCSSTYAYTYKCFQ